MLGKEEGATKYTRRDRYDILLEPAYVRRCVLDKKDLENPETAMIRFATIAERRARPSRPLTTQIRAAHIHVHGRHEPSESQSAPSRTPDPLKRFSRLPLASAANAATAAAALRAAGSGSALTRCCSLFRIALHYEARAESRLCKRAINVRAQAREKKKVFGTRRAIFTFPRRLHATGWNSSDACSYARVGYITWHFRAVRRFVRFTELCEYNQPIPSASPSAGTQFDDAYISAKIAFSRAQSTPVTTTTRRSQYSPMRCSDRCDARTIDDANRLLYIASELTRAVRRREKATCGSRDPTQDVPVFTLLNEQCTACAQSKHTHDRPWQRCDRVRSYGSSNKIKTKKSRSHNYEHAPSRVFRQFSGSRVRVHIREIESANNIALRYTCNRSRNSVRRGDAGDIS
ncbi:unnamed protein product [Trichogramma brassicae]|uniref:Uncharacterized protein n=1 Tax=Trichogramma brassicae TaxID=86971 RepID=A0A6H5IFA8_9HYME|nr:unnamed protein product [Trichogramma brassicae]